MTFNGREFNLVKPDESSNVVFFALLSLRIVSVFLEGAESSQIKFYFVLLWNVIELSNIINQASFSGLD